MVEKRFEFMRLVGARTPEKSLHHAEVLRTKLFVIL